MTTSDSQSTFAEARRESTSILTSAERRCLLWLAARVPRAINSDHLTVLALAAMAGAGACFWAARSNRLWLLGVVGCLAANWFGDSLDGTVARVRQHQRPRYGFYVDHVVDCFGVLFLFAGLALAGFMSPLVAMGFVIAYFMLSIEIYLATYARGVFKLSFAGMGPTELRLLLAAGALVLMRDPQVRLLGATFKLLDVGGIVAIVGLTVTVLLSVFNNIHALYLAEPIPGKERPLRPAATGRRLFAFNVVGSIGFVLQLTLVWVLTSGAGWHYGLATVVAVEAAILHNFFWNLRWTWSDRNLRPGQIAARLVLFNLTTGAVSLMGNVGLTLLLVRAFGLHYLAANVLAVVACSAVNFALNHRLVFAAASGLLVLGAGTETAGAATLSPAAAETFDYEVRLLESRLDGERAGRSAFLWLDGLEDVQQREYRRLMAQGDVVSRRLPSRSPSQPLPGAMLHHWMATALVPQTSLDRVVSLMQSYNEYQNIYRPAVRRSRLVARSGDTFTVALQLFTRRVIGVFVNTESTVHYSRVDHSRMQVRSVSTRIAEVENAGQADEREAPVGRDSGFLWRFNNYCALDERVEGTYVQCETLSLTRDAPAGLGWLIAPFVSSIPRESLEFTLAAMQAALHGTAR